jgi:ATP-dependent Clp protease adaptor protein ClpS
MTLTQTNIELEESIAGLLDSNNNCSLIVWNDDVNTFEWVIETLIEVCKHTELQAEQSAIIIHTNGKYAVKNGDFDTLKKMCDHITDRGINATVEIVSEK